MHLIWRQLSDGNTVVDPLQLAILINRGRIVRPASIPKDMTTQEYYDALAVAMNAAWSN